MSQTIVIGILKVQYQKVSITADIEGFQLINLSDFIEITEIIKMV